MSSEQSDPPCAAAVAIPLFLISFPPPHESEQGVQLPHSPITQLTGTEIEYNRERIWYQNGNSKHYNLIKIEKKSSSRKMLLPDIFP